MVKLTEADAALLEAVIKERNEGDEADPEPAQEQIEGVSKMFLSSLYIQNVAMQAMMHAMTKGPQKAMEGLGVFWFVIGAEFGYRKYQDEELEKMMGGIKI